MSAEKASRAGPGFALRILLQQISTGQVRSIISAPLRWPRQSRKAELPERQAKQTGVPAPGTSAACL